MEKKRVVPIWLSVVFAVLVVGAMLLKLYTLLSVFKTGMATAILLQVLDELTFLSALLYCFTGYKKSSSNYFFTFCILYTLDIFICLVWEAISLQIGSDSTGIFHTILQLIEYAPLCIFIVAKDLGRTKSYVLAGLVVICELLGLLTAVQFGGLILLTAVGKAVLAVVFGIMVYAKYQDKAARSAK